MRRVVHGHQLVARARRGGGRVVAGRLDAQLEALVRQVAAPAAAAARGVEHGAQRDGALTAAAAAEPRRGAVAAARGGLVRQPQLAALQALRLEVQRLAVGAVRLRRGLERQAHAAGLQRDHLDEHGVAARHHLGRVGHGARRRQLRHVDEPAVEVAQVHDRACGQQRLDDAAVDAVQSGQRPRIVARWRRAPSSSSSPSSRSIVSRRCGGEV